MATAAHRTIVQVGRVVETGALDPEVVVTPGICTDTLLDLLGLDLTRLDAAAAGTATA